MFKVVVSDLHLGAGYAREGNHLEDFWRDAEFADFVADLAAESDRTRASAELIFNGDSFEMLQVPHVASYDPAARYAPEEYHSSSEPDSARKMELIIAGHPAFFTALRRFLQVGPPERSITFIKGNHDVHLHWLAVQDRIRRAVGATGPRAALLRFAERCIRRDGIYVEHGNQYAELLSRVPDMEDPHDPDRPGQLLQAPGSWFVMDFLNQLERERYWIDGVKPIHALVWYALVYDFALAAGAVAALLRAVRGIVGEAVAAPRDAASDLLDQLENPQRVEEIGGRYRDSNLFRSWLDGELERLLPALSDNGDTGRLDRDAVAAEGPLQQNGVAKGDQLRLHIRAALHAVAGRCAVKEGATLVVFGHTHEALAEPLPDGGVYFNSGTWTWRADFSGAGKGSWRELFEHPERFTEDRLLTYVRIDYDERGKPTGRLLACGERGVAPSMQAPWWERLRDWIRWVLGGVLGQ